MVAAGGVAFAAAGDLAYLGGDCRSTLGRIEGKPRNNLAAVDLTTGHATAWAPNVAKYACVSAIAADADRVLAGGFFGPSLG